MPSVGTASVDLVVDKQQFGRSVTGAVDGNRGLFGGLGKKMGAAFVGGFAALQGVQLFKGMIDEAREAAKVTRLTNAVIASTKGAANIGAEGVAALSERLSNLAGVDDELIQSGANVLLTFTNIKNAAGAGNNVFDRATEAALNMSSALGTDLQGSIIQVGKALNDPIKGITALSRVGVSFTEQQKSQIKAMVAAGDALGAQKLILAELNTEFGGAAAAAADPAQKLGVIWGNLKEQVGTAALPILNRAATFLSNTLPGAITKTKAVLEPFVNAAKNLFDNLVAGIKGTESEFVAGGAEGVFKFGQMLRTDVFPIVKQVAEWLQNNWKTALAVAAGAFLVFTGPVTFIVATIAILYAKFSWFRDFIGAAIGFVGDKFTQFAAFAREIFPQVQEAIGHFVNIVRGLWNTFGDDILKVASAVWSQVQAVIDTAIGVIQGVIKLALAVINGDWGKAWDALKGIVASVWNGVKATIGNAIKVITGVIGGAGDGIRRAASGMFDGIKNAFKAAVNFIIRGWNRLEFKIPGFKVGPVGYSGFTLGVPDIPTLHSGGVYRAQIPGGEGLALLRDGERVSTPSALDNGPQVIQLVVEGRVLAEVTSQELQKRRAELN